MKIDWSFPKQVVFVLLIVGGCASYPLIFYGSQEVITAVVVGALLSTVNVLLGYTAIEYSFEKSITTFLKFVLGGMGIRLALILAAIVILIKTADIHVGGLVVSLGIFYIIYLTLEILFIQKKVDKRQQ